MGTRVGRSEAQGETGTSSPAIAPPSRHTRHIAERVRIRAAQGSDCAFLAEMLVLAADWRPGPRSLRVAQVLAEPELGHYVAGWPRPGDVGVVAEDELGVPIGASWYRRFPTDDPGYGFVAAEVPEVSIAVAQHARRTGVGRRLMDALIRAAKQRGDERLSLSVEVDNHARQLYTNLGFRDVREADGSVTMVLDVASYRPPPDRR